jgi:hypothetical protein
MQPETRVNVLHTHGLTQLRPCTKTLTEKSTRYHTPFKQLRCLEDGKYRRGTCTDYGMMQPYNHTYSRPAGVTKSDIPYGRPVYSRTVRGHSNIELAGSISGQRLSNVSAFTYGKS